MSDLTVTGRAPTASASRYLQQLCKHWSHKFEVSFDPTHGTIAMGGGRVDLAAEPDAIVVMLHPKPEGDPERMKGVVEEHLNRFAFREAPLPFTWDAPVSA